MTNHERFTPQEFLPAIDSYVDEEGEVRSIDDDPTGFNAEGHTPYGADFSRDEAVEDFRYLPEHLSDGDIDLTELLFAAKAFSHASKLAGAIKERPAHIRRIGSVHREREAQFSLGTYRFKQAVGYRALKEAAIAEGVDPEHFDHLFGLARNNFYAMNRGEAGHQFRENLAHQAKKQSTEQ